MTWRVTVSIKNGTDTHAWSRDDSDPPDYGVTDGLTITRGLDEDTPWPAHPRPATSTFGIVAATAADIPGVVLGARVSVNYFSPRGAATPVATFDGRISDVSMVPNDLGVLASVTCVDYLPDLAEAQVGLAARPAESSTARFLAFWAEAQADNGAIPDPSHVGPGTIAYGPGHGWQDPGWPFAASAAAVTDPQRAARAADNPTTLLDAVLKLLESWAEDLAAVGKPGQGRYWLTQRMAATSGISTPRLLEYFYLVGVRSQPGAQFLPGVFGDDGTGYGVVVPDNDPADFPANISANLLARNIKWTAAKGKVVNRTRITGAWGTTQAGASNGDTPPVVFSLETDLAVKNDDGERVADMYLPASDPAPWLAEDVGWQLWADTDGRTPPELGTLVGLAPIPLASTPLARPYYAALVGGWTLTMVGDRPTLELSLLSSVPRTSTSLALTWDDLAANHPTVTWDDLNARDTWDDYRLLRED